MHGWSRIVLRRLVGMNAYTVYINDGTLVMQPSMCLPPVDTHRLFETLARSIMKQTSKVVLGAFVVVIGLLSVFVWHLYRSEFVGRTRFDGSLYAVATTPKNSFSYDDYAATLREYVNDMGMVNYQKMKKDHKKLDDFLLAMARLDTKTYQSWDEQAKIAFWINAYNALTLKAIIDRYPIKAGLLSGLAYPKNSIRQIPGVWDKLQFLVMGQKLTLNDIEHDILRGQNKVQVEKYGRFYEPSIHMALVCAAMSCPSLLNEPYVGKKLDKQFDDQARKFLSHQVKFRIDRNAKKVYLSKIFRWFGGDFIKKYKPNEGFDSGGSDSAKAVLHSISGYVPVADRDFLKTGKYKILYLDYDWSLNEQKSKKDQNDVNKD
jgi:hypothetical protein